MDFTLLILGMDANAYYLARCYHEKYHKKAFLIGKNPIWYTHLSNILIREYHDNIWDEKMFLKIMNNFYEKHQNEKILLIASTEFYITLITKNRQELSKKFYFNYAHLELINTLSDKEKFYKCFQDNKYIKLPRTEYFDCKCDEIKEFDFPYPLILKPSDVVTYRKIDFPGKKKIYKIENYDELVETINVIKKSNYDGVLIIQEYIEGDDSSLFDSVVYCDKNAKVKRITFAQIGLQEHNASLVGNASLLINGYNQYGKTEEVLKSLTLFMEEINYKGFAEFDLKYDKKDNTFKVLEINPRQGRSSYYLTALGCNLVEILYRDLILNEELSYEYLDKEVLLAFVPKGIVKKYVLNKEYVNKALSLWKMRVNSIKYKKDMNFKRMLNLLKKDYRYYVDYKNGYWKNK